MNTEAIVEFKSGRVGSLAKVVVESIVEDELIDEFQRELHEFVNVHPGTILHLDLSHVRLFSCAVFPELLQIQEELRESCGALCLEGVHGNVDDIMALTGMDKVFTVDRRHAS
ncbi:MAG: STAS domain-containing protein [Candidatus Hydrogenedentes bacterium]|nr:STAS domain-containing protein [Candidatus Hydrogenedentota bacterium]